MSEIQRIFVSHHHSDKEDQFTRRLVTDLTAAGADVWVDDQGITSDDFVNAISEGLTGRQWLVLVMTPASVAAPWVKREVNTALSEVTSGRMRAVIPMVMSATPDDDIPILWRNLQRYDATHDYERARRWAAGCHGSSGASSKRWPVANRAQTLKRAAWSHTPSDAHWPQQRPP
jgi:hypothetical protein